MANIVDFGAIGDDKTDNTEIIQNLINSKKSVYIPKGVFRVKKLVINNDYTRIFGEGTLKCYKKLSPQSPFIAINSPVTIDDITINGDNKTSKAVEIDAQNVVINNCEIKNVYASKRDDNAIGLATYKGKVTIKNCHFHHIYAESNHKLSDSTGASRAIIVGAYDDIDIKDLTTIKGCKFYLITGEEGDCIQAQAKSADIEKAILIEDCNFNDFSRRAIKLSASNGTVKNCVIKNQSNYKNLFSAISAFGNNITIIDNIIDTYYANGLELGNDDVDFVATDYNIKNNNIVNYKEPNNNNESYGIIAMNLSDCSIINNTIHRRDKEDSAIIVTGCHLLTISNNKIIGGQKVAISIDKSEYNINKNIIVSQNKLIDSSAKYFIAVGNTKNSVFKNNIYKPNPQTNAKKAIYFSENCRNISQLNNGIVRK